MSESVFIQSFTETVLSIKKICLDGRDERIRCKLEHVLKNVAASDGQLEQADKSLTILRDSLDHAVAVTDPDGRAIVAFVKEQLCGRKGVVATPSQRDDVLRLIEFSRGCEQARTLGEVGREMELKPLQNDATDDEVMSWLEMFDRQIADRNALIVEYVDFVAAIFRLFEETGVWDKRVQIEHGRRLLEIARTFEARRREQEERRRLERERLEREERERIEAEKRKKEEQERRQREEEERIRREEARHRAEKARKRKEAKERRERKLVEKKRVEEAASIPEEAPSVAVTVPSPSVNKADGAKSEKEGTLRERSASSVCVREKENEPPSKAVTVVQSHAQEKAGAVGKSLRSSGNVDTLSRTKRPPRDSSSHAQNQTTTFSMPMWVYLVVVLVVAAILVWVGIHVVRWICRHWIISLVSGIVLLILIWFDCRPKRGEQSVVVPPKKDEDEEADEDIDEEEEDD